MADTPVESLEPFRVLFVCLGNICRSPLAEGVLLHLSRNAGIDHRIEVDSAGTGAWHVGEPPDSRSVDAAARKGVELRGQARRIRAADFSHFDLILAMDRENLRSLGELEGSRHGKARLALLREFDPASEGDVDVPDPYFGGPDGFDSVFELVYRSCEALLSELQEAHDLRPRVERGLGTDHSG